jgi:hypothetical protein
MGALAPVAGKIFGRQVHLPRLCGGLSSWRTAKDRESYRRLGRESMAHPASHKFGKAPTPALPLLPREPGLSRMGVLEPGLARIRLCRHRFLGDNLIGSGDRNQRQRDCDDQYRNMRHLAAHSAEFKPMIGAPDQEQV